MASSVGEDASLLDAVASAGDKDEILHEVLGARRSGQVSPVVLSAALSRLAKLVRTREACEACASEFVRVSRDASASVDGGDGGWQPRQLANTLWSVAKLLIVAPPAVVDAFHPLVGSILARMTPALILRLKPIELSMACWAAAKMDSVSLRRCDSQALTSCSGRVSVGESEHLWRGRRVRTVTALCRRAAIMRADSFTSQSTSNLLWALATIAGGDDAAPAYLAKLVAHVDASVAQCSPQELANIAWGIARLCRPPCPPLRLGRFLGRLRDELGESGGDFEALHVANIAWSIAKLTTAVSGGAHDLDAGTCGAILAHCARRMAEGGQVRKMTDSELAMALWAFAAAGAGDVDILPLMDDLSDWLARRAPSLESCQTLALVCWSLAKLECGDARRLLLMSTIVEGVAPRADALLSSAPFRDLSMTAWGLARMSEDNGASSDAPAGPGTRELVFAAIADAARRILRNDRRRRRSGTHANSRFEPRHVSNLIWSFAFLRIENTALVRAVAIEVRRSAHRYNSKDLTTALWAFAEMGVKRRKMLVSIEAAALACLQKKDFNAQSMLKFIGSYERIGGTSETLMSAMAADRELEYTFADLTLHLRSRAPGRSFRNTGVALWEASASLAEWLSTTHRLPKVDHIDGEGRPVGLELGAGLGLPSFVLASRGYAMTATDGDEEVLSLLRSNVRANARALPDPDEAGIRIERLRWGDAMDIERAQQRQPYDVLVAADCVYGDDPTGWQHLIDTAEALATEGTLLIVANVQRFSRSATGRKGEKLFLEMLFSSAFEQVAAVPALELGGQQRDQGVQIHLARLKRHARAEERERPGREEDGKQKKKKRRMRKD